MGMSGARRWPGDSAQVLAIVVLVAVLGAAGWLLGRADSDVRLAPGTGGTENVESPQPMATDPAASTADTAPADVASSAATSDGDPTPSAGPIQVAAGVDEADWRVLAVGTTSGWGRHVVTEQAEVDGLWRTFEMEGSAPVLPVGRGALVVTIAGTCDHAGQVRGLDGLLTADASDVYAAVEFDPGCAELEIDGTAVGPPWTLFVIAVPLHVVIGIAGPVAVVADVVEFDWEVLAVAATPDPVNRLGWVVHDQDGLDSSWEQFELPGTAPALPAGRGALVVPVSGGCSSEAELRAVGGAALPNGDGTADAGGAVYFAASCAQPLLIGSTPRQPRTVYAIAVPLGVARSFDGPEAFIACHGQATPDAACTDFRHGAVPADDPLGLANPDLGWEVLAVGVTPDTSLIGQVATEQSGVDDLWRRFEMLGSAPALPVEHGAVFVPVAGTCDQASQVLGIEPFAQLGEVWAVFHFDPGCAEPRDEALDNPAPRMLYVIAMSLEVVEVFAGAAAESG